MNEIDIYISIRAEIVENHALMHWFSIITAVVILAVLLFTETRKSIISVFLPIFTIAWAASMVRFDFFIHRQIAYLRTIEPQIKSTELSFQLWESWRQSLIATKYIIPIADIFICCAIVIPTIYISFVSTQEYFKLRQWRGGRIYAWSTSIVIIFLLLSLIVIPQVAGWR